MVRKALALLFGCVLLLPASAARSQEEDAQDRDYDYLELNVGDEGMSLVQLVELVRNYMKDSPAMKEAGRVKGFHYLPDFDATPGAKKAIPHNFTIQIPKKKGNAKATPDEQAEAMYNFLLSVLEIFGYSVADRGMFYEIVKSANRIKKPGIDFVSFEEAQKLAGNDEIRTLIYAFRNYDPGTLLGSPIVQMLNTPPAGPEQIIPIPGTRTVVITAYASKLQQIHKLLKLLDERTSDQVMEFIKLQSASATEIVNTLKDVIRARSLSRSRPGVPGGSAVGQVEPQIFANPRTNRELVLVCMADDLREIRQLVEWVDQPLQVGRPNIRRFKVRHRPAKDVHALVLSLYEQRQAITGQPSQGQQPPGRTGQATPAPSPAPAPAAPPAPASGGTPLPGGDGRSELDMVPPRVVLDEGTNSLIVVATTERVMNEVEGVINDADRRRPQVMLEAIAMELGPSATRAIGVELAIGDSASSTLRGAGVTSFGLSSIDFSKAPPERSPSATEGFTGFLFKDAAKRIPFLIQLQQLDSETEVLNVPRVLAEDNQEAIFNITNSEPYFTETVTTGVVTRGTAFAEAITNLTITPSISYDLVPKKDKDGKPVFRIDPRTGKPILDELGRPVPELEEISYVRMKIAQTISSFKAASAGAAGGAPARETRSITTNVAVPNGATIGIGGFTNKNRRTTVKKIPWLGNLPWWLGGFLFRSESETESTSTLFVFITPHIRDTLTDLPSIENELYTEEGLDKLRREKQDKGLMPIGQREKEEREKEQREREKRQAEERERQEEERRKQEKERTRREERERKEAERLRKEIERDDR